MPWKGSKKYFQAKAGSDASDEADVLLLIKEYENKHYVINSPSPIEAIKYRMEQQGLTNKDLAQILDSEPCKRYILKRTGIKPGHDPQALS